MKSFLPTTASSALVPAMTVLRREVPSSSSSSPNVAPLR